MERLNNSSELLSDKVGFQTQPFWLPAPLTTTLDGHSRVHDILHHFLCGTPYQFTRVASQTTPENQWLKL